MTDLPSWDLLSRRMSLCQEAQNGLWVPDKLVDLVSQVTGRETVLSGLE